MTKSYSKYILPSILVLFAIIFLGVEYDRTGDLFIYLSASKNLFSDVSLYHPLYGVNKEFFYLGNPFLTVLVYPFSKIPFELTAILFKTLSILSLYRIWILLKYYINTPEITGKQLSKTLVLAFIGCFLFIYYNLHIVQFTILLLYFSLEGIHQICNKKRNVLGALLFSFAIGIKLIPIVLVPYLVYRSYFKSAFYIIILLISYFYFPVIALGYKKTMLLWSDWWALIQPTSEEQIFDMNNRKNHGLSTLLSTLFIKDLTDNIETITNRRYLLDLGKTTTLYIIYASKVILVLFTLYFLNAVPFQKVKSKLHQFWELSYLFLIIPLFFPQQRIYNFFFIFPAVVYLFHYLFSNAKNKYFNRKLFLILFSFMLILLNLELILGLYRNIFWHYKTLTYATIFLLILLSIYFPSKKKSDIHTVV